MKTIMKAIISSLVIFFISFISFSQVQVSLKYNHLQGKVVKIEEFSYKFDDDLDGYYVESITAIAYNKSGNMVARIYQQGSYVQSRAMTTYTYNNTGNLINESTRTITLPDTKNIVETSKNYIYRNNNLIKIQNVSNNSTSVEFAYTAAGNIEESVDKNNLGELTSISKYSNYKNPDSYTMVYKSYDNGKLHEGTSTSIYENGNYISYSYIGETATLNYKYTYDSSGNELEEVKNGVVSEAYNYEYNSDGNWLKKRKAFYAIYDKKTYNTFTFRQITYENGTTVGSTNFDIPYIKKYETKSSYILKPYVQKEESAIERFNRLYGN